MKKLYTVIVGTKPRSSEEYDITRECQSFATETDGREFFEKKKREYVVFAEKERNDVNITLWEHYVSNVEFNGDIIDDWFYDFTDVPEVLSACDVKKKIDELKTMIMKQGATLEAFREFGLGSSLKEDINCFFVEDKNDNETHLNEEVMLAYVKLSQSLVYLADGAQDTREELRRLFDRVRFYASDEDFDNFRKKYARAWENI